MAENRDRGITPSSPAAVHQQAPRPSTPGRRACDRPRYNGSNRRLAAEHGIVASVTPYATEYLRLGTSLTVGEDDVDAAIRAVGAVALGFVIRVRASRRRRARRRWRLSLRHEPSLPRAQPRRDPVDPEGARVTQAVGQVSNAHVTPSAVRAARNASRSTRRIVKGRAARYASRRPKRSLDLWRRFDRRSRGQRM